MVLFVTFTYDMTKLLSPVLHGPQTLGAADTQLHLGQTSVHLTGARPAGVTPPVSSLARVTAGTVPAVDRVLSTRGRAEQDKGHSFIKNIPPPPHTQRSTCQWEAFCQQNKSIMVVDWDLTKRIRDAGEMGQQHLLQMLCWFLHVLEHPASPATPSAPSTSVQYLLREPTRPPLVSQAFPQREGLLDLATSRPSHLRAAYPYLTASVPRAPTVQGRLGTFIYHRTLAASGALHLLPSTPQLLTG